MIDQDKLKTMTQLALYEKKKGKKDFKIFSYDKDDYIRFEGLKTAVYVVLAFSVLAGIYVLWNMEYLISKFDVLNYKSIIIGICMGLFLLVLFYVVLSYRKCKEEYHQALPRVRRYQRGIKKLKDYYMVADKKQRDFEKGEWRNGQ